MDSTSELEYGTGIFFVVPATSVAQPRARATTITGKDGVKHARVYNKKHPVDHFKACVAQAANLVYPKGPPLEGPLLVMVRFVLPRASKRCGWKRKPMIECWSDRSFCDVDNLLKALLDALNGQLWRDDRQVSWAPPIKLEASGSEKPRAEVLVVQLLRNPPSAEEFFVPVLRRVKTLFSQQECGEWIRKMRTETQGANP